MCLLSVPALQLSFACYVLNDIDAVVHLARILYMDGTCAAVYMCAQLAPGARLEQAAGRSAAAPSYSTPTAY
jgi:hypothetical protein